MLVVIAGGIGCGKSAVLAELKKLGAETLSADELNRELLVEPEYIHKLSLLFPDAVIDGVVNKRAIRIAIFSNERARLSLNELAHPIIIKMIKERAAGKKLVFAEVPLLIESTTEKFFDKLVAVYAPYEIRKKRVAERDGISKDAAAQVIAVQSAETAVTEVADFIIDNSGGISELAPQVALLYEKCLNA